MSTPAREQARFLRALADHLEQNPELVLHSISTGARLALHDATEVVAWARSLGVTELRADSYEGFVNLAAEGTLGDHRVRYSKDLDRATDAVVAAVAAVTATETATGVVDSWARAAVDATRDVAWDACGLAARTAAWASTPEAVARSWDVFGHLAWTAARNAAKAAAGNAAKAAAGGAARVSGAEALVPAVEALQESAIGLLKRMALIGHESGGA